HRLATHPDDRVVVYDALTYAGNRASLADLDERICFVHGDICDQARVEQVLAEHHVDLVVNFAAESHNSLAVVDPARFFRTNVLAVTITNCCNNYGPYQFPEKVIPLFATKAVDGDPLPLYASTLNRREWLHVDDHCSAIDVVLERGGVGETYHVGSGREASIEELADHVLAALGRPSSLKTIVPDRPGHDRRYLLDSSKIRTRLGWEPLTSFEEGLADTVAWYAANRA